MRITWVCDIEKSGVLDYVDAQNAKLKTGEIKAPKGSFYQIGEAKEGGQEIYKGIYFHDPTGRS